MVRRAPYVPVNTATERFFKIDQATGHWDLSSYDPALIENKISIEEVSQLLLKMDAVPKPALDPKACSDT